MLLQHFKLLIEVHGCRKSFNSGPKIENFCEKTKKFRKNFELNFLKDEDKTLI